MNIDLLIKIAGVGILVSVLAQILNRTGREDMAMLTTLAGLAIVLLAVVNLISQLFQSVSACSVVRLRGDGPRRAAPGAAGNRYGVFAGCRSDHSACAFGQAWRIGAGDS